MKRTDIKIIINDEVLKPEQIEIITLALDNFETYLKNLKIGKGQEGTIHTIIRDYKTKIADLTALIYKTIVCTSNELKWEDR